ncbi:MAG: hypothetical protein GXY83_31980 [Rhodopirellula sp.]|nr:hypothetical protein [Rhodopirellula sp.]
MTHPFHPWFGREFALVTYRLNWGEERVYLHDDAGRRLHSERRSEPYTTCPAPATPTRCRSALRCMHRSNHPVIVDGAVIA